MLELTVDVQNVKFGGAMKQAALQTAQAAVQMEKGDGAYEAALLVTDDATIRHLNQAYRDIDKATDVLSFPAEEDVFLGDIAISMDKATQQAEEYGHSVEREIAFLTAHAMLHLMGYDHLNEEDETRMRARQREILEKAGYER